MGRTIPTFSIAIEHEKRRWKAFRNALYDKSDRKDFDRMFDIPKLTGSRHPNLTIHHPKLTGGGNHPKIYQSHNFDTVQS